MSLTEALGEGLQVTVIGLCIVFAVLVILMLVMMAMKAIFYKETAVESVNANAPAKPQPVAVTPSAPAAAPAEMDESELIAVLTAAIAASLNTSSYNLRVKSFRRIENTAPSWNKAGLRDVIESRF